MKKLFFLLKQKKYDEIIEYIMKNEINFNDYNILLLLKIPINDYGETIAHKLAASGYKFPINRMDILVLKDNDKWSVAHIMASYGYNFPEDKINILSIKDNKGWTVAHEMAWNGYQFSENRIEILSLKDNNGWSVAHTMAKNGYKFSSDRNDILMMKDNKNRTVYDIYKDHLMTRKCYEEIIFPSKTKET